jgi:hypothetical protein
MAKADEGVNEIEIDVNDKEALNKINSLVA